MHHTGGETETAYQAALDRCSVAVVAKDREGRVLTWNSTATAWFGWEQIDVLGEACPLSPRTDDGTVDDAVERVLSGERVENFRVTVTHRDGTERPYDLTLAPLDDSDSPDGTVATFTESSDEKVARLERQVDRLEEFTGVVVHDLRGPLNAAKASIELGGKRDNTAEHLDRAKRCLDRVETIVGDMLSLCRQGSDGATLTEVQLSSVVEEVWTDVDATGAHVLVDEDVSLTADRSQLRQLLENLFRNGVKHGSTDGRTQSVMIRVGPLADRDGFYVADDGPGIPADKRETVFEYGYTTDRDGTGYGLTIVDRIAEVHDWTVEVTDSEYGGARFEIYENFSSNDS